MFINRIMNFLKVFLGCLLAVVAGSILTFLFWIFVLVGIAGSMETPTIVKPGSVLRIDLAETLVDSPSNDPFASFDFAAMQPMPRLPLYKALRAVEAAAAADRIAGICLRPNGGGGFEGTALVEELRAAIADFKRSGKFVVAYNEYYTQGDYYLASVADSVYMQPEGSIEWSGLSMSVMFYKGLFDKLDLKAEVFRPASCKYKSAVEPYVLSAMSEANRRQMQALAESVWGTIVEAVSAARGIAPERLNLLADELAVSLPDDALRHGFIDGILYEDELAGVLERLGADPAQSVSLGEYAAGLGPDASNVLAPQVAVVYADGAVVDGEGNITEVILSTGEHVPCDFIIMAAGVRPRIQIAQASGIKAERAIEVDDHLRTSAPDVYAAGDCTGLSGVWPDAMAQGKAAAENMAGIDTVYEKPYPFKNTSNFFGVTMLSVGRLDLTEGAEIIVHKTDKEYKKAIVKDGKLTGYLSMGDISNSGLYLHLIKNGIDVSGKLDKIFRLSFADFYGVNQKNGEYVYTV